MTKTYSPATQAIHTAFATASDSLQLKAQEPSFVSNQQIESLIATGFINQPGMQTYIGKKAAYNEMRCAARSIKEMTERFHGYRIIDSKVFDELCKKYNLVQGKPEEFIGELPIDNLNRIITFEKKHPGTIKSMQIAAPLEMFSVTKQKSLIDDPIAFVNRGTYTVIITMWGKEQTIPELQNHQNNN